MADIIFHKRLRSLVIETKGKIQKRLGYQAPPVTPAPPFRPKMFPLHACQKLKDLKWEMTGNVNCPYCGESLHSRKAGDE